MAKIKTDNGDSGVSSDSGVDGVNGALNSFQIGDFQNSIATESHYYSAISHQWRQGVPLSPLSDDPLAFGADGDPMVTIFGASGETPKML